MPKFKMPENMETFGASDILPRYREMVAVAFVNGTRGGVTEKFLIPFPVWIINTTVYADRNPQYENFKMVLCYGSNGSVIDGEEPLNRGTMYRIIETSNTDVYMIISTAYIDRFELMLEMPRDYYDKYRPA